MRRLTTILFVATATLSAGQLAAQELSGTLKKNQGDRQHHAGAP